MPQLQDLFVCRTMSDFIDLLNAEIQEISSKKFNSKIASTNFSEFQRELAHCLFSEFVIEISDDDVDDAKETNVRSEEEVKHQGCTVVGQESNRTSDESNDDEERRQILNFIQKHLDDFIARYDQLLLESISSVHDTKDTSLEESNLQAEISALLPRLPNNTAPHPGLAVWSDVIESAVTSSWDSIIPSNGAG